MANPRARQIDRGTASRNCEPAAEQRIQIATSRIPARLLTVVIDQFRSSILPNIWRLAMLAMHNSQIKYSIPICAWQTNQCRRTYQSEVKDSGNISINQLKVYQWPANPLGGPKVQFIYLNLAQNGCHRHRDPPVSLLEKNERKGSWPGFGRTKAKPNQPSPKPRSVIPTSRWRLWPFLPVETVISMDTWHKEGERCSLDASSCHLSWGEQRCSLDTLSISTLLPRQLMGYKYPSSHSILHIHKQGSKLSTKLVLVLVE